jgi:hypothetical protein
MTPLGPCVHERKEGNMQPNTYVATSLGKNEEIMLYDTLKVKHSFAGHVDRSHAYIIIYLSSLHISKDAHKFYN